MLASTVTERCPSNEGDVYYHFYFQKNKQSKVRSKICTPSFHQVPLPMSVCVCFSKDVGLGNDKDSIRKGESHGMW